MRLMQKELEELREIRQKEARQAQEDREELAIFRDRCTKLEEEREHRQGSVLTFYHSHYFHCLINFLLG